MKNILQYNYNINIKEINKINDNYYFKHNQDSYIVAFYKRNDKEINNIYELNKDMLAHNIPVFEIVKTNTNSVIFQYKNNKYILMKYPYIKNRIITYNDILKFNYFPKNLNDIDKSNWSNLWETKIDHYESISKEIKEKYLNKSLNYYIGLAENGISYFSNNFNGRLPKVISHIRIGINTDLYEFLNPLNLIIDYKERDLGEYLKSYVLNSKYSKETINQMISTKNNNRDSIIALICRILLPTYYFDEFDGIILNNKGNINNIIEKRKNIDHLIKSIFEKYSYLNLPYINWIIKTKG